MEYLEFLTTYWSQISILIFAIGYLLKIYLEFQLKEKEIKFNFIHSKKAEAIQYIYSNFSKLSKEVESLAFGHYLSQHNQAPTRKENRNVFWKIVELNKNIKTLTEENQLYFKDDFIKKIETFCKNIDDNIIITSINMNDDENLNSKTIYNNSEKFVKFFRINFPSIKKNIIDEFRSYL